MHCGIAELVESDTKGSTRRKAGELLNSDDQRRVLVEPIRIASTKWSDCFASDGREPRKVTSDDVPVGDLEAGQTEVVELELQILVGDPGSVDGEVEQK